MTITWEIATTFTISGGVFQAGATFASPRNIALTAAATIDTQNFTMTLITPA